MFSFFGQSHRLSLLVVFHQAVTRSSSGISCEWVSWTRSPQTQDRSCPLSSQRFWIMPLTHSCLWPLSHTTRKDSWPIPQWRCCSQQRNGVSQGISDSYSSLCLFPVHQETRCSHHTVALWSVILLWLQPKALVSDCSFQQNQGLGYYSCFSQWWEYSLMTGVMFLHHPFLCLKACHLSLQPVVWCPPHHHFSSWRRCSFFPCLCKLCSPQVFATLSSYWSSVVFLQPLSALLVRSDTGNQAVTSIRDQQ